MNLFFVGQYLDALEYYFLPSKQLIVKALGPYHPEVVTCEENIIRAKILSGNFTSNKDILDDLFKLTSIKDTGIIKNNFSNNGKPQNDDLFNTNATKNSFGFFRQQRFSTIGIGTLFNNIGNVLRQQNRAQEALRMYGKALKFFEKEIQSIQHLEAEENDVNNQVKIENVDDSLEESFELFMTSFSSSSSTLGMMAASSATTTTTNQEKSQLPNNSQTQKLPSKKVDGQMNLNTLKKLKLHHVRKYQFQLESISIVKSNIGSVYFDMGNMNQALKWYLECKTIRERIFGMNNFSTIVSLKNVALTELELGRIDFASEKLKKTETLLKETFSEEKMDPDVQQFKKELSGLLSRAIQIQKMSLSGSKSIL